MKRIIMHFVPSGEQRRSSGVLESAGAFLQSPVTSSSQARFSLAPLTLSPLLSGPDLVVVSGREDLAACQGVKGFEEGDGRVNKGLSVLKMDCEGCIEEGMAMPLSFREIIS